MKRKALGRGLSALLPSSFTSEPENREEAPKKEIHEIPVDLVQANRSQPRRVFDDEKLLELAESIRNQGILQPLIVRLHPELHHQFLLIAGERRLRAAKLADLPTVPCIVLQAEDAQSYVIALIENIQRTDLSPVEEAKAYRSLMDNFSLTQEEVSNRVGKSREAIANLLRLLNLPESVLYMLQDGLLSPGHAKVLLALKDEAEIETFALRIIEENLSVREVERLIRERLNPKPIKERPKKAGDDDIFVQDLQDTIEQNLQTKVRIKMRGKSKGSITIDFYDLDQLDALLKKWQIKL